MMRSKECVKDKKKERKCQKLKHQRWFCDLEHIIRLLIWFIPTILNIQTFTKRIFQPFGPSRPHFLNLESGATFPRWLTSSAKFHIKQPTVVCQSCGGLAPINHAVGSSKQRYGEAYGLVSSSTAALLPPKFLRITVPTTKTASGLMVPPSSASSTLGKNPS